MQNVTACLLLWALVVHTLINGGYQDAILDVYSTRQQCYDVRESQSVNGECYEVASVIHNHAA
ncbi:DUF1482 family protein [Enterobacter ludwigii]|uniref:DUF1482 family protein n=1 Tax=Enterobacter ludwigii TaxID=299767 RepID=UPI000AFA438A|nr:DUF1482 family protein [Enterobacter ludwigii]